MRGGWRMTIRIGSIAALAMALLAQSGQPPSRSVELFEAGDFAGAARGFAEGLERDPDSLPLRFNLGLARYYEGDLAEASRQFQMILDTDPKHPSAHFMLGVLAKSTGSPQDAIGHFKSVLSVDPNDPATFYQLGQVANLAGDLARAIECFRESLRREPGNPSTIYNLARTLLRAGQTEEGRRLMTEFKEIQKRRKTPMTGTMGEPSWIQGKFAQVLQ